MGNIGRVYTIDIYTRTNAVVKQKNICRTTTRSIDMIIYIIYIYIYVYMYICIYVYMYICIYVYMCIDTLY